MGVKRDFRDSTFTDANGVFGEEIADMDYESWWDSGGWTAGFQSFWGIHDLEEDMRNVKTYLRRVCEVNDLSVQALRDILDAVHEVEYRYGGKMGAEVRALEAYRDTVRAFTGEMGANFPRSVNFAALGARVNALCEVMEENSEFHYMVDDAVVAAELDLMRVKDEYGKWVSIDWEYVLGLLMSPPGDLSDEQYTALYLLFLNMQGTTGDGAALDENLQRFLNSSLMMAPGEGASWDVPLELPASYSFVLDTSPVFDRMYQLFEGTEGALRLLAMDPAVQSGDPEALRALKQQLTHLELLAAFNSSIGEDENERHHPYFTLYGPQSHEAAELCRAWQAAHPGQNVPFSAIQAGGFFGDPVIVSMGANSGYGEHSIYPKPYSGGFMLYVAREYNPNVAYDPTGERNETGFWYGDPGSGIKILAPLFGPNASRQNQAHNSADYFDPLIPHVFENDVQAGVNGAVSSVFNYTVNKIPGLLNKIPVVGPFAYLVYKMGEGAVKGINAQQGNLDALAYIDGVLNVQRTIAAIEAMGGVVSYHIENGRFVLDYIDLNERELWLRTQAYNRANGTNFTVDEILEAMLSEEYLTGNDDGAIASDPNSLATEFGDAQESQKDKDKLLDDLWNVFEKKYVEKCGTLEGAEELFNNLSPEGLAKLMEILAEEEAAA